MIRETRGRGMDADVQMEDKGKVCTKAGWNGGDERVSGR